jgi:hypothetical protein
MKTRPDDVPSADLSAWADRLRLEVVALRRELEDNKQSLIRAEERLELVNRLLALDGVRLPVADLEPPAVFREPNTVGADLEEAVVSILEECSEPLHIGRIRELLIERGVAIPGRGDEANIILRLRRREDLFTRTARGTYGLAARGLTPLQSPKRVIARRRVARK